MRSEIRNACFMTVLLTYTVLAPLSVRAGDPPTAQDFAQIERGRYLTAAADCAACHTDPADNRPFAGGRAIETPFGIVAARLVRSQHHQRPDPRPGPLVGRRRG